MDFSSDIDTALSICPGAVTFDIKSDASGMETTGIVAIPRDRELDDLAYVDGRAGKARACLAYADHAITGLCGTQDPELRDCVTYSGVLWAVVGVRHVAASWEIEIVTFDLHERTAPGYRIAR